MLRRSWTSTCTPPGHLVFLSSLNVLTNIFWPHSLPVSNRANEEIAQVRTKASAENMALTASLRKEQMKNESMEQALQQKVTDNISTPRANSTWSRRVLSSYAVFAAVSTVASSLCFNRIKRSRNSPRSVMSWLPKWGKLTECHSQRINHYCPPCSCPAAMPCESPPTLPPKPRSSSHPLYHPCIIETAYVQMSKVTSSVMQSHDLRPVHACHCSSEDTVLCRSQCFACNVAHHEATWASWAFHHASGQQQPACDSTQIPRSLTTKYPAAPSTGWHQAGWGCFKVTFKHRVYFNEIWQGLIYDKATIHRMYFSMKYMRTLLWKSKAQGYSLGQNEVRVKSSCTRGKDFGLFEEIPQSSEALVCSGMTLKSQCV